MSLGPFAASLVVPPVNLVPLGIAGIVLAIRYRRARLGQAGLTLAGGAFALLFVLSLPFVGGMLLVSLEHDLPLTPPPAAPPQAIVILAAEVVHGAIGTPQIDVGPLTLQRLRAGAALARRTGLPVLVSGGRPDKGEEPIGMLMAESLEQDFGVTPRWIEAASEDTWGNARDTAAILKAQDIRSIYLVTHAWHMRRALIAFDHFGLRVTAAPTWMDRMPTGIAVDFAPRVNGWVMSFYALHEWIGCAYYALRR